MGSYLSFAFWACFNNRTSTMKKLLIFFLLLAGVASAQIHDTTVVVSHDSTYTVRVTVTVTHDSTYKVGSPVDSIWRGVYISGLSSIAGTKAKEDIVINGLLKYKFKHTFFYSIDGANDANVTKFFTRIRKETGADIGATASSANTFINTRLKWNAQHGDSADYNAFNFEYEPWNATDVASAWATNITYLQQTRKALTGLPVLLTDYFGWWTKSTMVTQTPDTLVKYLDYELIHDYRTTPDWSYMRSRCNDLNQSGIEQGKITTVRAIFSAEPAFLQTWLKTHKIDEAYAIIKAQFDAMHYTNLKMDGYLVFTLDFLLISQSPPNARLSAPVTADPNFKNETTQSHLKYVE